MTISIDQSYYDIVAGIESGNNPYATSSTSSASGLYGFTKKTFTNLGQSWSNVFDVNAQNSAMSKLTQQNASTLATNGIDITNQNLYTAHFLGANNAVSVLTANNSTPLSSILSATERIANPHISNMNVGQFKDYTAALTHGDAAGDGSSPSTTDLANTAVNEGSQFAVDVATGDYVKAASDGIQDILGVFGIGNRKPGGNADTNPAPKPPSNIFEWIANFFSAHTATRFAFVVIGIVLVVVAAVYLAANSDAGKTVINNVKEVGGKIAETAVVAA